MITRAASKRVKTISGSYPSVSAELPTFIPFKTEPTLEHIPEDVLLEIVSHLPIIIHRPNANTDPICHPKYVMSCTTPARMPTLRALSKTSRVLRLRCLALAWQRVEFWPTNLWTDHTVPTDINKAIVNSTETGMRILKACPYLLPLIQMVSVILTSYQRVEFMPKIAACLATLPNLSAIQIVYARQELQASITNAFQIRRYPSVRRISLPDSTHEIIRSCPNLEEITCVNGSGDRVVQSLAKGKCHQVRVLKGISAPLTELVNLVPNMTHASVAHGSDMSPLTGLPLLDTIEILVSYFSPVDTPLSELAALDIKKARVILRGNKSQATKTVVVTKSNSRLEYRPYEFDVGRAYMTRETFEV